MLAQLSETQLVELDRAMDDPDTMRTFPELLDVASSHDIPAESDDSESDGCGFVMELAFAKGRRVELLTRDSRRRAIAMLHGQRGTVVDTDSAADRLGVQLDDGRYARVGSGCYWFLPPDDCDSPPSPPCVGRLTTSTSDRTLCPTSPSGAPPSGDASSLVYRSDVV